jgi:anthranilate synthase/aminodeoxychorismate synthase-like glutamine amidotransferase
MRVLVLDNYDSFVYNLSQALRSLGAEVCVVRNDAWTLAEVSAHAPDALLISPGPGRPDVGTHFGICTQVIHALGDRLPMLGVCLGHQGIVHAFGGRIVRANQVMHGKCSEIIHDGQGLFSGIPDRFDAMRYHSLVADPAHLPDCLAVQARTSDGTIMAVSHRGRPLYGVQFHPESIGTPQGARVLANFLRLAGEFHGRATAPAKPGLGLVLALCT